MKRIMQPTALGMQIKMGLFRSNMTQVELARRIGKSEATISEVISGKNKSEETKLLIMKELGLEDAG